MKILKLLVFAMVALVGVARAENLTVYFTQSGNTERLATAIYENVGGDIARILPVVDYPESYDEKVEVAKREKEENARPEYQALGVDVADYDTIFLGYPNWWGHMPMIVYTFLENNDFAGKTIVPFVTYESSGVGDSISEIKRLAPDAIVMDGFSMRGLETLKDYSENVQEWLKKIGKL